MTREAALAEVSARARADRAALGGLRLPAPVEPARWRDAARPVLEVAAKHDDVAALSSALLHREPGGAVACDHDLPGIVRGLLTGLDESHGQLDEHGRPHHDAGLLGELGLLDRPVADELCLAIGHALGAPTNAPARWPGGATWVLCLTMDIDSAGLFTGGRWASGARWLAREQGPRGAARGLVQGALVNLRLRRDPHHNWLDVAEQLAADGVPVTAFVQALRAHRLDSYSLRREHALVRAMREWRTVGWEVQLHSAYDSPARDAAFLRRQRRVVERLVGGRVTASRAHYLRADGEGFESACAAAGLRTECSAGFPAREGFRRGTALPWRGDRVARVPLHAMDVTLRAHRGLSAPDAMARVQALAARCQRVGGVLVVDWHPHNIDGRWGAEWDAMPLAVARWARANGAALMTIGAMMKAWEGTRGT